MIKVNICSYLKNLNIFITHIRSLYGPPVGYSPSVRVLAIEISK
jgi:hypothetical protein